MSFHLQTTQTFELATAEAVREKAQALKDLGGTEAERLDKATRKAHIKDKLMAQEMLPFRWGVGHVPSLKLSRRVNGQHSSLVLLELNAEEWAQVRFPVVVYWEDYLCETKVDLATLFEQFDPPWSGRNTEDLMGPHVAVHDGLVVDRWVATHATAGIKWYRTKVLSHANKANLQFELIHENHDVHRFLSWCQLKLEPDKTREMYHRGVLAALYHTTLDADESAFDFWVRVAAGRAHNDVDSIEYKLADFFYMVRTFKGPEDWHEHPVIQRSLAAKRRGPSDLDVFATALRGFMAFRRSRRVGEIFEPAKNRTAAQLVADLYPLT